MRTDYHYHDIAFQFNKLIEDAVAKTTVPYTGPQMAPNTDWYFDNAASKINQVVSYLITETIILEADRKVFVTAEDWVVSQGQDYLIKLQDAVEAYTP